MRINAGRQEITQCVECGDWIDRPEYSKTPICWRCRQEVAQIEEEEKQERMYKVVYGGLFIAVAVFVLIALKITS